LSGSWGSVGSLKGRARTARNRFPKFTDDCAAGLWIWLSVTDRPVANAAESLRTLSKRITIRSADALHLACAREHGLGRVYTNDRHMLRAAPAFGVEAMGI
jgi:predicted nucleic acid-binding protein